MGTATARTVITGRMDIMAGTVTGGMDTVTGRTGATIDAGTNFSKQKRAPTEADALASPGPKFKRKARPCAELFLLTHSPTVSREIKF